MDVWTSVQGASLWLLVAGATLMVFGLIAYYRIEAVPRRINTALIWLAALLLALGAITLVAPYLVIFLGAHPA